MAVATRPYVRTGGNFGSPKINLAGCVFYAPLWRRELAGTTILSSGVYGLPVHSCAVTGTTWGGTGRTFDGNDLINIDSVLTSLASTTAGTFEMWGMLPDATPAALSALICFGDTNALEIIRVFVNTDGTVTADCYDATVKQWELSTNAAPFTDNVPFHFALTQGAGGPVLYVNGAIPAQTFAGGGASTATWFSLLTGLDNGRLGSTNYDSGGERFAPTGLFGEVRFYNRALSIGEIKRNRQVTQWRYQ